MTGGKDITITKEPDGPGGEETFTVELSQGSTAHRYLVTVPPTLAAELGHPAVTSELLVRESFVFLLEREPPSSIMSTFSLSVISRYFPEYERVMAARIADSSTADSRTDDSGHSAIP